MILNTRAALVSALCIGEQTVRAISPFVGGAFGSGLGAWADFPAAGGSGSSYASTQVNSHHDARPYSTM
ncbi:hypothetical protein SAMN05444920_103562 [Nonomuraea solani]|uniref:Uncharacterized protein n=1 Tax=Nonomuraea solani TaxID=1144553 RepID=A0A1H6BR43_9ACTN|nr:hypothetical protein [Nonomuraea solani]SEG62897.1 hypothetical protein SAMN05444920_103562 [Nonomuraea solani]